LPVLGAFQQRSGAVDVDGDRRTQPVQLLPLIDGAHEASSPSFYDVPLAGGTGTVREVPGGWHFAGRSWPKPGARQAAVAAVIVTLLAALALSVNALRAKPIVGAARPPAQASSHAALFGTASQLAAEFDAAACGGGLPLSTASSLAEDALIAKCFRLGDNGSGRNPVVLPVYGDASGTAGLRLLLRQQRAVIGPCPDRLTAGGGRIDASRHVCVHIEEVAKPDLGVLRLSSGGDAIDFGKPQRHVNIAEGGKPAMLAAFEGVLKPRPDGAALRDDDGAAIRMLRIEPAPDYPEGLVSLLHVTITTPGTVAADAD
jgi:hypothetical protein